MKKYSPKQIEKKWQDKWYNPLSSRLKKSQKKEKFNLLVEFPYPSGDGCMLGHCRS
jgi:leucyl-tRNA synthetase